MLTTGADARATAASNTGPPIISGSAVEGATLTSTSGSWSGTPPFTFAYAWLRCDAAGTNCIAISGATEQTYVLTGADVGSTIRIQVTATDATGPPSSTAESLPTAVVTAAVAPVATAEPAISGSTIEGQPLQTTNGTWSGSEPITFARQWVRCGPDGGAPDGSNCTFISGATSSTYTLTSADVGQRIRARVTASNVAGSQTAASNATATVSVNTTTGPPRNAAEPTITGTLIQGRILSASVGTWTGAAPITFAYQWVRCGADGGVADGSNCTFISGATSSTYTLTSADVGERIRIRITASNSAGVQTVASNASAAVQSAATAPTPAQEAPRNTRVPSISGTANAGQTLFASVGTWAGTLPLTYAYQWVRCGADGGQPGGSNCPAISGATGPQYALTAGDVGQRLRVQVTARNTLGTATATSDPTAQVQTAGATPPPSPAQGLPPGAIRLPNGKYSIPITSVSLPERLIIDEVEFTPNPVRSRETALELRVHVVDTRGYAVRDAIVFARATPIVTSAPGEQRTGRDGWARLRMTPQADFPLQDDHSVQFWVRARKQTDDLLAGVSNRRLVQVATSG
jgi:hypothetical protein